MPHWPHLLPDKQGREGPAELTVAMKKVLMQRAGGRGSFVEEVFYRWRHTQAFTLGAHPKLTLPESEICAASTETEEPPEMLTPALALTSAF